MNIWWLYWPFAAIYVFLKLKGDDGADHMGLMASVFLVGAILQDEIKKGNRNAPD